MAYIANPKTVLSSAAIFAALLATLWSSKYTQKYIPSLLWRNPGFVCEQHHYTTEIISTSPLLIYINNFITPSEASALIALGEQELSPSLLYASSLHADESRTSQSAALEPSAPVVQCVLSRARHFLGPSLLAEYEDFGTPQMVRYHPGEKFDLHYDWYPSPQPLQGRRGWYFNRIASFFVYLDEPSSSSNYSSSTYSPGGETWFPLIETRNGTGEGKWESHKDGGTAFRPLKGNALFWVNLGDDGKGDQRVRHAGLPLKEGVKTAMNIWPRRFHGGR